MCLAAALLWVISNPDGSLSTNSPPTACPMANLGMHTPHVFEVGGDLERNAFPNGLFSTEHRYRATRMLKKLLRGRDPGQSGARSPVMSKNGSVGQKVDGRARALLNK